MVPAFTRAKPRQRVKPCRRLGGGKCKATIMKGVVKYLHQQDLGFQRPAVEKQATAKGGVPRAEKHASPELYKPCRHQSQGCAQSQPQHQQPDALSSQRMPQVAAAEEVGWCQGIAHSPVASKDLAPQVEGVMPAAQRLSVP